MHVYLHPKELKGLKVRFHRPDGALRDYRVNGFGPQVHVAVEMGDGKRMSVGKYIHDEYKHDLKHRGGLTLQGSRRGFYIVLLNDKTDHHRDICTLLVKDRSSVLN